MTFTVGADWSDKDSKVERFRKLYEDHDFLSAYAQHTDLRVQDDPRGAIGRVDEWESHGLKQREFLLAHGLRFNHYLLDLGCGTGRLARRIVTRIDTGHYTGADISPRALAHARDLADMEKWAEWKPDFVLIDGTLDALRPRRFDMIWAHSVFTHLPEDAICNIVSGLTHVLVPDRGQFLFTYKRGTPARTGLKQFCYDVPFFENVARAYRFKFTSLDTVWPAGQRTGMLTR